MQPINHNFYPKQTDRHSKQSHQFQAEKHANQHPDTSRLISGVPDPIRDFLQINCQRGSLAIDYSYMTVQLHEFLWTEGMLTTVICGWQERSRRIRMWRKSNRVISIWVHPIARHRKCMEWRESLRCARVLRKILFP